MRVAYQAYGHCRQLKTWSAELQLLPFKTAEAVLLQAHRLVNLIATMLNTS